MPPFESFRGAHSYNGTLAYELAHWTLHAWRLDRDFWQKRFGDNDYVMEELVAELNAAFCAPILSLFRRSGRTTGLFAGWLKALKDDKRAIFTAASHAQKVVDFLHGVQVSNEQEAAA